MKILVTGSNGLLGQKLIKLLLVNKVEVIATGKGESRLGYLPQSFVYVQMDIVNRSSVIQTIADHLPDVVINTAAMTNVDQCEVEKEACWELNVIAVQHLIDACDQVGARLIHLSTDFIFDGLEGPYDEDAKPNPLSYYGESKVASELLLQKSDIHWIVLRTVLVYGITPGMSRSNIILWVKDNLENGKPLKIVDDQWRTPTLAEDLAMGCFLAASTDAKGVFNISGPDLLTPFDMAMKTCDYFGLDKSLITKVDGSTFSQPAKRPPRTGFILDKAKKELGYKPTSFDEGIAVLNDQMIALSQ